MRTRPLLVAGLVAVALVVVVTLGPSEPRRSGTNNVPVAGTVARLAPGAEACQPEDVPADTRIVRLRVEPSAGRPRPVVRIAAAGRRSADVGRRSRPAGDGAIDVAFDRTPTAGPADVCVRNDGARPLVLLGYPTGERHGPLTGQVTLDYYRRGSESWWQLATTVAHRMGLGKSGLLGDWTLWLAVALVLAAWALAATALWRIGAPQR